ncbi:hypothetical protein KHA94_23955 [Bacillus sp. FJAT-49705]|uniref:Uncharacterized protein n=1 Tax=Cytobacillus citreus TaxID=2833586 RepID=A0ABS5P1B8_9BACI|nr:hypothetical protein [Cytobacillus citreus]MBS4193159.1 hypothetical protein [Cytobacillus citreus]
MAKYISIIFLSIFISIILFMILVNVFAGGDHVEEAVYTFGTIIVILLSFAIAQIFYIIDFIKKK